MSVQLMGCYFCLYISFDDGVEFLQSRFSYFAELIMEGVIFYTKNLDEADGICHGHTLYITYVSIATNVLNKSQFVMMRICLV